MGEIVSDRVHCPPPTPQNPLPLPLQLPQTVICSLLEMKSKEKKELSLPKTQEVKKPSDSCWNILTFSGTLLSF